jgi:dihydroorotate dehydrogenase
MSIYSAFIRQLLFKLDPEQSHYLAHEVIAKVMPFYGMTNQFSYKGKDLQVSIFDQTLTNPVGLAAGFDKNADLVHAFKYLGLGYAEIGSITGQEHGGNPQPRLWRLPEDKGLINWMGLNGKGAAVVAEKLAGANFSVPIAVNIAKTNKANIIGQLAYEDILSSFRAIRYLPVFYVTINVSCPNTSEGILEETSMISAVLEQIVKENHAKLPLLLKLSPDSDDKLISDITALGKRLNIAGYICGNTSLMRQGLKTPGAGDLKAGGLSGQPLKPLNLALCRKVYSLKERSQIIIGCGGISSGQDAYDFIRAGASLLQLYTALIYEGPGAVKKICQELSALMKKDKVTLNQTIGSDCVIANKN